ncbi:MAG: sodium:proton exchanger, partial [Mycobacteriaceae bacterium]|nr:sodium:proton exchanger [Mycobacteriaceae bacterium]
MVDVLAWIGLGGVVATAGGGLEQFAVRTGLGVLFGCVMAFGVRPIIARACPDGMPVAGMSVLALGCAAFTELIGLHAIFGALAAGLVMPRGVALDGIEGFTTHIGLPAFFADLGLHIDLRPLLGAGGVAMTASVIGFAVAGKVGATVVTALLQGCDRASAFALAAMMNCRGLTELVVLSVGRSLGLISTEFYGALVVMALCTSAATGPILRRLARASNRS